MGENGGTANSKENVSTDKLIVVLALGNRQRQQDGFGPALLDYMRANIDFPPCIVAISAGLNPLSYYPLVASCRWLILLDAVATSAEADVPLVLKDPFLPSVGRHEQVSTHELNADNLLLLLDAIGQRPPRVSLLGLNIRASDLDYREGQFGDGLLQSASDKLASLLSLQLKQPAEERLCH